MPINQNDIKFLFESYLEYVEYLNSINEKTEFPTFESHEKFVNNFLQDKDNHDYEYWYILYLDDEKIGNFNIKKNKEFGYQIINKYQGKGIGTQAFEKFFQKHPKESIWARTKPKNIKSQKILKKFGFKLTEYEFHY